MTTILIGRPHDATNPGNRLLPVIDAYGETHLGLAEYEWGGPVADMLAVKLRDVPGLYVPPVVDVGSPVTTAHGHAVKRGKIAEYKPDLYIEIHFNGSPRPPRVDYACVLHESRDTSGGVFAAKAADAVIAAMKSGGWEVRFTGWQGKGGRVPVPGLFHTDDDGNPTHLWINRARVAWLFVEAFDGDNPSHQKYAATTDDLTSQIAAGVASACSLSRSS